MLRTVQYSDLESFVAAVIPQEILENALSLKGLQEGCTEIKALEELQVFLHGCGYYKLARLRSRIPHKQAAQGSLLARAHNGFQQK